MPGIAGKNMMKRRMKHCHPMIANLALDRIGYVYDLVMQDNYLYAQWKAQHPGYTPKQLQLAFFERNWGKGVEDARKTLAHMLNKECAPGLDENARIDIHEALVLDASLRMGRKGHQALSA